MGYSSAPQEDLHHEHIHLGKEGGPDRLFTMLEDSVALGVDQSETIYSFIQQLLSNVLVSARHCDACRTAGTDEIYTLAAFSELSHQGRRKP